jgi:hypothetical protein
MISREIEELLQCKNLIIISKLNELVKVEF